jgi:hypothetical protein
MQSKYALTRTSAHAALLPMLHFDHDVMLCVVLARYAIIGFVQTRCTQFQQIRQSLSVPSATVMLHFLTKHY